jgi:hypothetical protein
VTLTAANRAALDHVRAAALRELPRHRARLAGAADVEAVAAALRRAPLTINFHPDRLLADGRPVAQALHDEGVYRSQFETRISNGGLTAYPGGDRDRWEAAMFGGAYQVTGVREAERPKYGGLNVLHQLNGACPGFGSCHLRLRAPVLDRATLIYGDSVFEPTDIAVADVLEPVLAPLVESEWFTVSPQPAMTRRLEDYVEAQVHGPLELRADVEAVVIDPAFGGTPAGDLLVAAAERHGFAAEWRPARVLSLAAIPADTPEGGEPRLWKDFCAGGRARALAERVTGGAPLDAANIGAAAAAAAAARDPETLQHVKYLWRMVVVYGD